MNTHDITGLLKGANIDAIEANYSIQAALEQLVDASELARENGDAQLISACELAEVTMRDTAQSLQLSRAAQRQAIISQLDGFNREKNDD